MGAEHGRDGGPSLPKKTWVADLLASFVAFLVAVPLCIGIAVACGVPAERGLVTGIIGGIVVGTLAGAPLLVSGPAASLIVPVFDLVRTHGLTALAPVVMLAGAWQIIAGVARLGQWFRAVAPAVIHGMLIGIGILICASQLHVAIDGEPNASFFDNVVAFFPAFHQRVGAGAPPGARDPVLVAAATIVLLVGWNRFRPARLKLVPGHLVALLVVIVATLALRPQVMFLDISPTFFSGLAPPSVQDLRILRQPEIIGLSLVFAFVASAATLLTASAIDRRQSHTRADYDREMLAQGIGNALTGSVGGLPMTGVIVRSSVNVDAGARTRLSAILHGVWILIFVSLAPELLERIPRASLGATLVYTGFRLIDHRALVELYRQGRAELGIALITLLGVVFVELFVGIVAGLAAAFVKLIYTFSRLEVRSEPSPSEKVQHLHLTGSATFIQLPRLAKALDAVPKDRELHVHIDELEHIDHACLELLSSWRRQRETENAPGMVVQWDELTQRYRSRHPMVGVQRTAESSRSLWSLVWAEWKRIYAPRRGRLAVGLAPDWLDASRVRVRLDASSLDDVLFAAAQMLAPAAGIAADEVKRMLRHRIDEHVALGAGVSVPHTLVPSLPKAIAALVVTREPIDVPGEPADVFFVLLAPENDPEQHLRSLAHVGRLCHDTTFLERLRRAETSEEAAALVDAARRSMVAADAGIGSGRHSVLAVLSIDGEERTRRIAALVGQAFFRPVVLSREDRGPFEALRRVLLVPRSRRLVLVPLRARDLDVLRPLLGERSRLFPDDRCEIHLLHLDDEERVPSLAGVARSDGVGSEGGPSDASAMQRTERRIGRRRAAR